MRTNRWVVTLALCFTVTACGGDSGTTEPRSAVTSIAGSYAGGMIGLAEGVALQAVFSITLGQNGADLTGSYGLTGDLRDGVDQLDVIGTGSVTGNVGSGANPSINIVMRPAACPNRTANFSGSYDGQNRRISVTGPVQFTRSDCSVFVTYLMTIVLTR